MHQVHLFGIQPDLPLNPLPFPSASCRSPLRSAVERVEEKARFLVQLAEYEDRHGRNYDPSNEFPPESRLLGFVFSKSAVLGRIELGKRLKQA